MPLVVDISAVGAIEADLVADVPTASTRLGTVQRLSFAVLAPLGYLALTSTVVVEAATIRGIRTAIAPFARDEAAGLTATGTIDLLSAGTITPLGDIAIAATLTVEIATFVAEAYKTDTVVIVHTAFVTGAAVTGQQGASIAPPENIPSTPTSIIDALAGIICGQHAAPAVFSGRPSTSLSGGTLLGYESSVLTMLDAPV